MSSERRTGGLDLFGCINFFRLEERRLEVSNAKMEFTSGELLFRSRFLGSNFASEWHSTLQEDVLDEPRQGLVGKEINGLASDRVLGSLEIVSKDALSYAEAQLERMQRKIASGLKEAELKVQAALEQELDEERAREEVLIAKMVQFAANIDKECKMMDESMVSQEKKHEKIVKREKAAMDLEAFALHLEYETNGEVLLNRLESHHPQSLRCQRAASKNVKSDFFGVKSVFSELIVSDVFKIENKTLLGAFQEQNPREVKGLFCLTPKSSLAHVVVAGASPDKDADCYKNLMPLGIGELERRRGFAEERFMNSIPLKFPCRFSRYSTMEADRPLMMNDELGKLGDSEARYLVLCRVIVDDVFSTSSDYRGFPKIRPPIEGQEYPFDAMYSPSLEEFLVLDPKKVLPEFILRFHYRSRFPPLFSMPRIDPVFESVEADLSSDRLRIQSDGKLRQLAEMEIGKENMLENSQKHRQEIRDGIERIFPSVYLTSS